MAKRISSLCRDTRTQRRKCSAGIVAPALANRLLLNSASPQKYQILLWDRVFVPLSRAVDIVIGHAVGRSILVVWR